MNARAISAPPVFPLVVFFFSQTPTRHDYSLQSGFQCSFYRNPDSGPLGTHYHNTRISPASPRASARIRARSTQSLRLKDLSSLQMIPLVERAADTGGRRGVLTQVKTDLYALLMTVIDSVPERTRRSRP